jgi:hypothetical protein
MIRDEHIEAAVAQGILTADQAARLRALALPGLAPDERQEPSIDPDDERFRLIGGFNDVFVTIGVVLLVSALFALSSTLGFRIGFAGVALIAAWGLSEIFSTRMRLALPSIALALMFSGAGAFLALTTGGTALNASGIVIDKYSGILVLLFGLGAVLSAAVHERRFHVPIDAAIAAAGLVCAITGALMAIAPDWTQANKSLLIALFGIGIFAAAVRVDASDRRRLTRRSDVAFWLHLLAAPMIVHAAIPFVSGPVTSLGVGQAVGILVVFVLLGLVALVIDRRALLVSGLAYAGFAIAYLLSESVAKGMTLSLTLLGLAILVLGLSAGWRRLRRAILPVLPLGRFRQLVPPLS